jgi:pantoate--beta-alanine ligase
MVKDLDFPVRVEGVETVRESDGLAMSSRNSYLSPVERLRAPWLYRALDKARSSALKRAAPSVRLLLEGIRATVHGHMGARIDYVDAVSQEDLSPLQSIQPGNTMIAAAVFLGNTRLIDNVRF